MAKGQGYQSRYAGIDFDEAIEFYKNQHDLSTIQTVPCSPDNLIDLDAYNVEEGIFIINYFYHSADDSDASPVVLTVVFLDEHTVMQKYNLNGVDQIRKYSDITNAYTDWLPFYEILTAKDNQVLRVPRDTTVLREVSDKDSFFSSSNGATEKNTVVETQHEDGSIERHFPFTKLTNVIGAEDIPLYPKALALLSMNPYLIDDTSGFTYRLGVDEGKLHIVRVDKGVKEILQEIEGLFDELNA